MDVLDETLILYMVNWCKTLPWKRLNDQTPQALFIEA
jgi:hypothetical protein